MKSTKSIAIVAILLTTVSCVDKSYDLANLDKSITILPGIEVPVKNGDVIDETLDSFMSVPDNVKKAENGALVVTSTTSEDVKKVISDEDFAAGKEIKLSTTLETEFDKTNKFLSIPGIGAALYEPAIMINVKNPSPYPIEYNANVTDGKIVVPIKFQVPANCDCDVYLSENGTASPISAQTKTLVRTSLMVPVFDSKYVEMFTGDAEIPSKLSVKDIYFKGKEVTEAIAKESKKPNYDLSMNLSSVLQLAILPNASFDFSTQVSLENTDIDIEKYKFEAGDQVVLKGKMTFTGIPLEFTPSITENSGKATFSISPKVILASEGEVPVEIFLDFVDNPSNISMVTVKMKVTNPTSKIFFITGKEKFSYNVECISSTNGVNL